MGHVPSTLRQATIRAGESLQSGTSSLLIKTTLLHCIWQTCLSLALCFAPAGFCDTAGHIYRSNSSIACSLEAGKSLNWEFAGLSNSAGGVDATDLLSALDSQHAIRCFSNDISSSTQTLQRSSSSSGSGSRQGGYSLEKSELSKERDEKAALHAATVSYLRFQWNTKTPTAERQRVTEEVCSS